MVDAMVEQLAFDLGYSEEEVAELRAFSKEERAAMAETGDALPDGSYPIETEEDVRNAVVAIKSAPRGKRKAAREHITKRARELDATGWLPEGWA